MPETRVRIPVAVLLTPREHGAFRVSRALGERLGESHCSRASTVLADFLSGEVAFGAVTTPSGDTPDFRLLEGEEMIWAVRRTSWVATFLKIITFGFYIPWWKVAWFAVTDQRIIGKEGIFNKDEIALPLHFVQDASVQRNMLGVARVDISTAGGREGNLVVSPLRAVDARRFADTVIARAKLVGGRARQPHTCGDAITDDLVRLAALRDSGALTEEEFAQQKARLLKTEGA